MLKGFNHLTLAVSDLAKSIQFYHHVLGLKLHAAWDEGAYLSCGDLWLCLAYDPVRKPSFANASDYTHYAFSIKKERFNSFIKKLKKHGITPWKENKSEGESFYFLDPDEHKLEIHVGNLESRLNSCRSKPYSNMKFYS